MAIHEERRLTFDLDAVRSSLLRDGGIAQALQLPPNGLKRLIPSPSTQTIEAEYLVLEETTTRAVSSRLSSPQIAALLINYCAFLKIPLPRNSTKRLVIENEAVVLTLDQMIEVPA